MIIMIKSQYVCAKAFINTADGYCNNLHVHEETATTVLLAPALLILGGNKRKIAPYRALLCGDGPHHRPQESCHLKTASLQAVAVHVLYFASELTTPLDTMLYKFF